MPNLALLNSQALHKPSEAEIQQMDEKLALDMMRLAVSERELALDDLHGISSGGECFETPSMLANSLELLNSELHKIKGGTAYEQAEMVSSEYVSSSAFRLLFLRSVNFNARDAAAQMIRYFEDKMYLFGREKITKEITLSDLTEEDLQCLSIGFIQILPKRDAAGRTVVAYIKGLRPLKSMSVGRSIWYVMSTLLRDEEIQKKGLVYLIYHVDAKVQEACLSLVLQTTKLLFRTLPVKKMGTHLCTEGAAVRPLAAAALRLLSTSDRVRYRVHIGSHLECIYQLRTFGITSLPVDVSGNYQIEEHLRWIQKRRELEDRAAAVVSVKRKSSPSAPSAADVSSSAAMTDIGPNDVLFGRGAPVRDNPGNTRFRKIVDQFAHKYECAERLEKGCIAYAVVVMINESDGRFLHRCKTGVWEEVDASKARDKVHQTFRNIRHQK